MVANLTRNERRKISVELPAIPDKRYFTIGEVAKLCALKTHVLRYWEQEFSALNPMKRRGNRRYYRYEDVLVIRKIRKLLYEEGFTIDGARAQLAESQQEIKKDFLAEGLVKKLITDLEVILQKIKVEEAINGA